METAGLEEHNFCQLRWIDLGLFSVVLKDVDYLEGSDKVVSLKSQMKAKGIWEWY